MDRSGRNGHLARLARAVGGEAVFDALVELAPRDLGPLRATPAIVALMRHICVFCGSSTGARPSYADAARRLGQTMAASGIGLVYGGAHVGLMGLLADAVMRGGGSVIGVIPRALEEREIAHTGLTELRVVGSMHERKAAMADLADGFIALPGGMGTMEELFEVLTWAQLGMHQKPCGLLDVDGYFGSLLAFLDHMVGERFLLQGYRDMLQVDSDPARLLAAFEAYQPVTLPKWIDPDET